MEDIKKKTPLMQQYESIKAKYPDAVLLFRVGEFYESFGEYAKIISEVLDIPLTKRNEDLLAGFPFERLYGQDYLVTLVRAGYRVAICNELNEDHKEVNFKRNIK